jgi:hypothetical protein
MHQADQTKKLSGEPTQARLAVALPRVARWFLTVAPVRFPGELSTRTVATCRARLRACIHHLPETILKERNRRQSRES